jgi:hypothetical protein
MVGTGEMAATAAAVALRDEIVGRLDAFAGEARPTTT